MSRKPLICIVVISSCICSAGAGVDGIYIEADEAPNLRTVEAFVADVAGPHKTNRAKAIALWGASCSLLPHSARSFEPLLAKGRGVEINDPIKLWNVYGFGICSYHSHALQACFRGVLGWPSRNWEIHHTVNETYWDNAWHVLDASKKVIYPDPADGHLASIAELSAPDGVKRLAEGKYYFKDFKRIDPQWLYNKCYGAKKFIGMDGAEEYFYGQFMDLSLRRGEVFTRYFAPLGKTRDYWYGQHAGKAPTYDSGQPAYANGVIEYTPPLSGGRCRGDLQREHNLAWSSSKGKSPAVHPAGVGSGWLVLRISSPYVITSAVLSGDFFRNTAADSVKIFVCPFSTLTKSGADWGQPVWTAEGTGRVAVKDVSLTSKVRGRYQYLVKIALSAAAAPTDAGIESISLKTIVQNAPAALPRLKPGKNTIRVTSGTLGSIQWNPWLITDDIIEQAYRSNNMGHADRERWQGMLHPTVAGEWGEVVYKFQPPGDIASFLLGGYFYIQKHNQVEIAYSWDDKTYTIARAVKVDHKDGLNLYKKVEHVRAGRRTLYVRYRLKRNPGGGKYVAARDLRVNLFYKSPAETKDRNIRVTYAWMDGGKLRTNRRIVTSNDCTYTIETSKSLPPTHLMQRFGTFTKYVRLELVDKEKPKSGLE